MLKRNCAKGQEGFEVAMPSEVRVSPPPTSSARRSLSYGGYFALIVLVCVFLGITQDAIGGANPSVTIDLGQTGPKQTAVVLQILALLTVLSLAPAFFIMVTSFTRVVIVLSFIRQAIGTQAVPPNQIIISLALFITVFVMAPVGEAVYSQAVQPLLAEQISYEEAWTKGIQPIRAFMLKQVRDKDLELFIDLSKRPKPATIDEVPIHVVIPAYIMSELRVAFQIGFLIYIPFLIIDMVVASILMSMGMMLLPPAMISLPFKLILFVLADGWNLVIGSLVKSFQ
jgi:flagellar biosynthetic protein FliP